MTDAIEDQDAVWDLLGSARAVLFDFDGPVCDLFRGASTEDTAAAVKDAARARWGPLDQDVEDCTDSHDVLVRLREMYERRPLRPDPTPLASAERIVTDREHLVVRTAEPAPDIDLFLDLLHELGIPLVIVSNNAVAPIEDYVGLHGLEKKFTRVFGRNETDARLMKPDPDCLKRALSFLGLPASACLMVGDKQTDLEAAQAVGCSFLGYTQDVSLAAAMKHDGADAVILSYDLAIDVAAKLADSR